MKTSRLLASLFGAAVMAVMAVGCNKTDNPDNPNKPGENTTDTLPVWGISKLTVNAEGGAQEVEFEPTGDWTFVSKTDWLTVGTASGTKVDRLIKFTAKPNTTFAERTAETVITVDGVAKDLKIVQKAAMRYIKVYSSLITFAPGDEEVIIPNIYANVDFEVSAKPTWVKSVELNKVDTVYEALVTLNPADFDDEDRTGVITFKDKASDYAVSFTLKCDKNSAYYVVTADDVFDFPFESENLEELKASFIVSAKPGAEEYRVVAYDVNPRSGQYTSPTDWATITAKTAPAVAYDNKEYGVELTVYEGPFNQGTRKSGVFVVPVSIEQADEINYVNDVVRPVLTIAQNKYTVLASVDIEEDYYFTYGTAATSTVKFKVRTGESFNIAYVNDNKDRPVFGDGLITLTQAGDKVSTAGWDTYTYNINFPATLNYYEYSVSSNLIVLYPGEPIPADDFDPWDVADVSLEIKINTLSNLVAPFEQLTSPNMATPIAITSGTEYTGDFTFNVLHGCKPKFNVALTPGSFDSLADVRFDKKGDVITGSVWDTYTYTVTIPSTVDFGPASDYYLYIYGGLSVTLNEDAKAINFYTLNITQP